MAIVVVIDTIQRTPTRNVTGYVRLKWNENILGDDRQLVNVAEDFDIPENGREEVITIDEEIFGFGVKAKVTVFEKPGVNQVCVQGRVEVMVPIGPDIGHDLDENCHPIPNA